MNEEQIEYWNGAAADRWTRHQEALDRALDPFGRAMLARAKPRLGEQVIDIGCGCGATVIAVADAIGESGRVTGVDVSDSMLTRARERTAGRPSVSLVKADAAEHVFGGVADLIVSRFGIMFFRDPVAAFRNLRTALHAGGRIAFACWRAPSENAWVSVPVRVALEHVEAPPPVGADEPGPFAFADRARIEGILGAAGFTSIDIEPFDTDVVMSTDGLASAADFALTAGMAARLLAKADDETKRRVEASLLRELAPHCKDDCVRLGGATWIASAIAP